MPHPERQVAIRRLQQQMIVIGHLAEGVHHPVEARANDAQHLQPVAAVSIVQENVFPSIPARGDMINGPGEFFNHRCRSAGTSRKVRFGIGFALTSK
jgi:hypothetical protein